MFVNKTKKMLISSFVVFNLIGNDFFEFSLLKEPNISLKKYCLMKKFT